MTEDLLFSHLEELRTRLIVALSIFFIASIGAYFFSHSIIDFFTQPLRGHKSAELIFQTPHEAFLTHIRVSATAGFFIASPVIFSQFWLFVSPGLYSKEKKIIFPLVLGSVFLFFVGSVFAYFVVVPFTLTFLLSFQTQSLRPLLSIAPYFSFLTGMILSFGIIFEFPIIILGLVKVGITTSRELAKSRKIIALIIFIAAAVLTPSPDPVTQLLLAIPLIVLFEMSVIISRWIEKKDC